ncbi:MAG: hypothetical protein JOZ15_07585 [Acidobacteria bacterium]|nr:hypothetical protein [Acidobacteriota bacterium]
MKKSSKKLTLNRDTLLTLAATSLRDAAAGAKTSTQCTQYVSCPQSCGGTCDIHANTCFFCTA